MKTEIFGLLLKSEKLLFHKQWLKLKLEKLTKEVLKSSQSRKWQTHLHYLVWDITSVHVPTHQRKSKNGNRKWRLPKLSTWTLLTDSLCFMHSIKTWNRWLDCFCSNPNMFWIIIKISSFTWGHRSLKNRHVINDNYILDTSYPLKWHFRKDETYQKFVFQILYWPNPSFNTKRSYPIT